PPRPTPGPSEVRFACSRARRGCAPGHRSVAGRSGSATLVAPRSSAATRQDAARMSVRMGAFDADPGIRPGVRQFVAYAVAWEPIPDDGLPRHSESARVD